MTPTDTENGAKGGYLRVPTYNPGCDPNRHKNAAKRSSMLCASSIMVTNCNNTTQTHTHCRHTTSHRVLRQMSPMCPLCRFARAYQCAYFCDQCASLAVTNVPAFVANVPDSVTNVPNAVTIVPVANVPGKVTNVPCMLQMCLFMLQMFLLRVTNVPIPLTLSLSLSLLLSLCAVVCLSLFVLSMRSTP